MNNKDSATSVRRIRLGVFGASVLLGVFLALLPFAEERMRRGGHLLWLHFLAVDYLWLPGGLLASIRYPQGVHTGSGAPNYFVWVTVFNFVIYSTLAYFVGVIVTRKRPSKRTFRA